MPTDSSSNDVEKHLKEALYRLSFIAMKTNDDEVQEVAREAYRYIMKAREVLDVHIIEQMTELYLEAEAARQALDAAKAAEEIDDSSEKAEEDKNDDES